MNHPLDQSPHIPQRQPSPQLLGAIMLRISRERQRRELRRRVIAFSLVAGSAAILAFPAWQSFRLEAAHSGFSQYLALAEFDFAGAMSYWKEFGLSLLESLPAMSLAAVLGTVLVLGFSITRLAACRKAFLTLKAN